MLQSPDGKHDPAHILLKISIPAPNEAIIQASHRARSYVDNEDHDFYPGPSWGRRRSRDGRHGPKPVAPVTPIDFDAGLSGRPNTPLYWPPPGYNATNGPGYRWGPHLGPGGRKHSRGCPPPGHHRRGPPPPPPLPSVYLISTNGSNGTQSGQQITPVDLLNSRSGFGENSILLPRFHPNTICHGCNGHLLGVRWLCANCPTAPSMDLVGLTCC